MILETFFEKFDLFADVPDAVPKMRELVLSLAVQGKLTPQFASDDWGEKLLQKIQGEKSQYELIAVINITAAAANLLSAMVAELTGTASCPQVFAQTTSGAGRLGRPRKMHNNLRGPLFQPS